MILRDYQADILAQIQHADGNDLVQLDTGAGKTPIIAALARQTEHCIVVAHRNILIEQASEKLAAFRLEHDVIASEHTRRRCAASHIRHHGRSFVRRGVRHRIVASIDTIASRMRRAAVGIDTALPWLIQIDEAHHVVAENKWGVLRDVFPAARIIGFTGTPARLDGKSLHSNNGGLFMRLVQADALRQNSTVELIRRRHLCPMRVISPPAALARLARGELAVVGEPIEWYQRLAPGRRAVAMCASIRNAEELAEQFRAAGIPAACISSEMSAATVAYVLDAFGAGRVLVLCNVDMVGEGFDLPSVEVLIMLRRTASFVAYRQWIGRVLRPADGKREAIIIDHVGNVIEHGMPDEPVAWDLLAPPRGLDKIRSAPCVACGRWYPVDERRCPDCGETNALLNRGSVGGHYVYLRERIDTALVERERRAIAIESEAESLRTRVIWPASMQHPGHGLIERTRSDIRRWFVAGLESAAVQPGLINEFLRCPEAETLNFWCRQFSSADVSGGRTDKIMKVFKKWQKSRSLKATRHTTAARQT